MGGRHGCGKRQYAPYAGMAVRSHRWCDPRQRHSRPMFTGPLALEEVHESKASSVLTAQGGYSRKRCRRRSSPAFNWYGIQVSRLAIGNAMLSAHGSTTPRRSCHQRSSTPASKPGIFQCGRPNGDQGGEIKDNRLHVPGLASRDGLDLDQRTDTVWPNQGTVSPLLVGLWPWRPDRP